MDSKELDELRELRAWAETFQGQSTFMLKGAAELLRTAQSQLAQERERVKVLQGVAVTARDVLDDAHCTDRKHGSDFYVVMYEYIDRLEQALSAADEQKGEGD